MGNTDTAVAAPKRKSGRPMTDGEKAAVIIMRSKNLSVAEIAQKTGRAKETIQDFLSKVRRMAESQGIDYDFREDLKMKSIDAVKDGLDCNEDPYKRATLGVNVLRGINVFTPDTTGVNVNLMVNSVPPEWNDRFITLEKSNSSDGGVVYEEEKR